MIALSLLGELSRQGRTVIHATGSRSFTQTLRKVAGVKPGRPMLCAMFKPCVGAPPKSLAKMFYELGLGGVNVIKGRANATRDSSSRTGRRRSWRRPHES